VINDGGEESSSGESSDDSVGQRTSPYKFRNRHAPLRTPARNTRSSTLDRYNMFMVYLSIGNRNEQYENRTVQYDKN